MSLMVLFAIVVLHAFQMVLTPQGTALRDKRGHDERFVLGLEYPRHKRRIVGSPTTATPSISCAIRAARLGRQLSCIDFASLTIA